MTIKCCSLLKNPEDGDIEVGFFYTRNDGTTSSFMVNEEGVVYGMDFPEDLPELEPLHDQGWIKEEAVSALSDTELHKALLHAASIYMRAVSHPLSGITTVCG